MRAIRPSILLRAARQGCAPSKRLPFGHFPLGNETVTDIAPSKRSRAMFRAVPCDETKLARHETIFPDGEDVPKPGLVTHPANEITGLWGPMTGDGHDQGTFRGSHCRTHRSRPHGSSRFCPAGRSKRAGGFGEG